MRNTCTGNFENDHTRGSVKDVDNGGEWKDVEGA
jgi:hypothetical protein